MWQFSLRSLMLLMSAVAFLTALVVSLPPVISNPLLLAIRFGCASGLVVAIVYAREARQAAAIGVLTSLVATGFSLVRVWEPMEDLYDGSRGVIDVLADQRYHTQLARGFIIDVIVGTVGGLTGIIVWRTCRPQRRAVPPADTTDGREQV